MLSYIFRQLLNSAGVFFRTIRAFFTRQLTSLGARARRLANFSRHATKVANSAFQGAAAAIKPPSKREDYIETKRLFISKSFLITLALVLIALGVLCYAVVWPFLLSHFFTAHFWQGDERVEDWSGKVVVYYDEEKDIPCYSGKLEEGLLQGKGKQYDENGLLIYEGNFTDGMRNGQGTSYEKGVMVYQGSFLLDAADGQGTLYENGTVVYNGDVTNLLPNGKGTAFTESGILYSGGFENGLYSGEGTLNTADGTLLYKGGFSEGLYSGEGVLYYPDGKKQYVGSFADGLYSGQGILYREDGAAAYEGEFADGLYNGSGTLKLEDDHGYVVAQFTNGVTDGDIQWYVDGKLWYSGGADDLTPDGYGELYLRSGKLVYAGEMDRGIIDGQWLLGLTAAELREAFAEAAVDETQAKDGGFLLTNRDLGLVVRCTYQTEEEESRAFSAWISRQGGDMAWKDLSSFSVWSDTLKSDTDMTALFPWKSGEEFDAWVQQMPQQEVLEHGRFTEQEMEKIRCHYDGWYCTGALQNDLPVIVSWTVEGEIDAFDQSTILPEESAQAELDALLAMLDGVAGKEPAEEEKSGPDTGDFLQGIRSADDAAALISALLDYYENEQTYVLLSRSKPLREELLTMAAAQAAQGGGEEAVTAARRELDMLDLRLTQSAANREKALLTISKLTECVVDDYDLSTLLVSYQPAELDAQVLCKAAVDYATGLAEDAASVDEKALSVAVKTALINLTVTQQELKFQRQEHEDTIAAAEKISEDYATGLASRSDLLQASCVQNDSAAALYAALCDFARETDALNHLTGGALSAELDWMKEPYAAVFAAYTEDIQAEISLRQQQEQPEETEQQEEPQQTEERE